MNIISACFIAVFVLPVITVFTNPQQLVYSILVLMDFPCLLLTKLICDINI